MWQGQQQWEGVSAGRTEHSRHLGLGQVILLLPLNRGSDSSNVLMGSVGIKCHIRELPGVVLGSD